MEGSSVDNLTKKQKRELKKKQKELKKLEKEKKVVSKKRNKKILTYLILIFLLAFVGYFIFILITGEKAESYTKGSVHWHSRLKVFICGEEIKMPAPKGEHHVGLPLLHTHEDRLIHIEGIVWKPGDITLGKYMEAIGKNFKDNELLEKGNGASCNGKSGKVKLLVEGVENIELTNYVIKNDEDYELRFE